MAAKFKTTLKDAMLTAIRDAIDAGATGGLINVYTGTQPATPETGLSGNTLLGTLTFATVCGTISSGVLTMAAITEDSSADNSGTATWARITDSTGTVVMDVDVSSTVGSGAIKMNTTVIVATGPIRIASFVISFP